MGKTISWKILLLSIIVVLSACGGGKYSDAIEVNDKFADATEEYINNMEKANDAASIANAVDDFAAAIEKIAPEMKKIAEKYPELKDRTNIPPELKESRERMDSMENKMAGLMMKSMTYMKNPEVREAQKRLQNAMMLMMK